MENKKFNKGEVVKLNKLDSPNMVVLSVEFKGTELIGVKCGWFDRNSAWQECTFHSKDLDKV